MDTPRIVIPIVILIAGVAAFLALGKKDDEKTEKPHGLGVPEVEVDTVGIHEGTLDIGVDGQAVPYREIKLSAEVAGRIEKKHKAARAGRFASKGDMLIEIDEFDYDLAAREFQNQLDQAGVSVQELQKEIDGAEKLVEHATKQEMIADRNHKRQIDLFEKGYSSDAELDQAERELIDARNSLTTVNNQLSVLVTRLSRLEQAQELTRLQWEKADYDLKRTKIAAPVDGVIVQDSVEEGDYVTIGTHLLTIEDTTTIEVKCNLQMDELYWVWDQAATGGLAPVTEQARDDYQLPRTPASVIYRLEGQEYVWDGFLWRIEGVGLDEKTRTVPCRVIVEDPQIVWAERKREREEDYQDGQRRRADGGPPALVRGMYVDVLVHTQPSRPLLSVSQKALRPGGEIWLARELSIREKDKWATGDDKLATHKLVIVEVDVIESDDQRAIVRAKTGELSKGDEVVVTPLALPVTSPGDDEDSKPRMLLRIKRD